MTDNRVALVAGGSRAAGRAITVELADHHEARSNTGRSTGSAASADAIRATR